MVNGPNLDEVIGKLSLNELREKLRDLIVRREELKKLYPFKFYTPLTKKHQSFHEDPRRFRLVYGSNRSGKSYATLVEPCWQAIGWWPDYYPKQCRAPIPCRCRILSTSKAMKNRIIPFMKRWIPAFHVRTFDQRTGVLHLKNQSIIQFMTFDMDIQAFAGDSIHHTVIDEHLPDERIFNENVFRLLDVNGRMVVNICPWIEEAGGGLTWEYDRLYTPAIEGRKDYGSYQFLMTDNPILSAEDIAEASKGLTDEEKEARIHGRFVRVGGLIFHEYQDTEPWLLRYADWNLNDPKIRNWWKENARVIWSIDPAATRPSAVLAIGLVGDSAYAVDEIFRDCSASELSRRMNDMMAYTGRPETIIYDYNADVEEKTSGMSFLDVLREYFPPAYFHWRRSVKHNEEGHIIRVKEDLILNPDLANPTYTKGLPRLRVSEKCHRLRTELTHWGRNPKTSEPQKEGNDQLDNLRYIYASLPSKVKHEIYEPDWMVEARKREMEADKKLLTRVRQ